MIARKLRQLHAETGGINSVESLRKHLQIAMEIELSTLPPYMCALYSIPDGCNIEVAGLIRSVLMEEMLHLTLAANLLNAVGGTPVLTGQHVIPHYPTSLPDGDGSFSVSLQPFGRDAISTFLRIELPTPRGTKPSADGYATIGQFYEAVEVGMRKLSRKGELRFDHHPERQITPADYYNGHGNIIMVSSLDTAIEAIHEICDQGEGAHHGIREDNQPFDAVGYELAHYYRFMEISVGRRFKRGDTSKSGPTGALLPVDWNAAKNMVANPRAGWFAPGSPTRLEMDACNQAWIDLLRTLEAAFQGGKQGIVKAVPLMLELKQRAIGLMNIPSGIADTKLGPSFELP